MVSWYSLHEYQWKTHAVVYHSIVGHHNYGYCLLFHELSRVPTALGQVVEEWKYQRSVMAGVQLAGTVLSRLLLPNLEKKNRKCFKL